REPVEGGRQIYECATILTARGEKRVVLVRAARQGHVAMYDTARDVIEDLMPGWLMQSGIAGGVPSLYFTPGSVIVANYIHNFAVSEAHPDGIQTYQQVALGQGRGRWRWAQ